MEKDSVIIYEVDGELWVCYPNNKSRWSLEEIALKDVPEGIKFKIINRYDLPESMTFRDAWTADFTDHDGVGMGATAFFKERGIT